MTCVWVETEHSEQAKHRELSSPTLQYTFHAALCGLLSYLTQSTSYGDYQKLELFLEWSMLRKMDGGCNCARGEFWRCIISADATLDWSITLPSLGRSCEIEWWVPVFRLNQVGFVISRYFWRLEKFGNIFFVLCKQSGISVLWWMTKKFAWVRCSHW